METTNHNPLTPWAFGFALLGGIAGAGVVALGAGTVACIGLGAFGIGQFLAKKLYPVGHTPASYLHAIGTVAFIGVLGFISWVLSLSGWVWIAAAFLAFCLGMLLPKRGAYNG